MKMQKLLCDFRFVIKFPHSHRPFRRSSSKAQSAESDVTQNPLQQLFEEALYRVNQLGNRNWRSWWVFGGRVAFLIAVHSVHSRNVAWGESQSLAHCFAVQIFEWDDCVTAVNRESGLPVVLQINLSFSLDYSLRFHDSHHHWAIVVLHIVICYVIAAVSVKVVFCSTLDLVPNNLNVVVAFRCRLLMEESQCVEKFMHDGVQSEASKLSLERLQVQVLSSPLSTHIAPTATVLALFDVIESLNQFNLNSPSLNSLPTSIIMKSECLLASYGTNFMQVTSSSFCAPMWMYSIWLWSVCTEIRKIE